MRRSAKGRYIRQKKAGEERHAKIRNSQFGVAKLLWGGNSDVIGGKPARIFERAARDGRANGGSQLLSSAQRFLKEETVEAVP